MTPVPGSFVSTRSSLASVAGLPSQTITMPAWIELPIPTPPPWWTLTQEAPDDDRRPERALAHHAVEAQAEAVALAVPEPADPRGQALETHVLLGQRDPPLQPRVVGELFERRP